jgi:hypothetical protein
MVIRNHPIQTSIKHWSFIVLVCVVSLSVNCAILLTAWHTLAPGNWCWLNDAELDKVQQFLTACVICAGAGLFFHSRLQSKIIYRQGDQNLVPK